MPYHTIRVSNATGQRLALRPGESRRALMGRAILTGQERDAVIPDTPETLSNPIVHRSVAYNGKTFHIAHRPGERGALAAATPRDPFDDLLRTAQLNLDHALDTLRHCPGDKKSCSLALMNVRAARLDVEQYTPKRPTPEEAWKIATSRDGHSPNDHDGRAQRKR